MPGQVRINFNGFTGLDVTRGTKVPVARPRPMGTIESAAARASIHAASTVSGSRILSDLLSLVTPPMGTITLGGTIPGIRIRSPYPDFTVAWGYSGTAGIIIAATAGGGMYFWNKRPDGEIGLYGSVGAGIISNMAAGVAAQVVFMFGPAPAVLAGDSITLSVDIDIGGGSVGGMIVLAAPPGGVWPPNPALLRTWIPEITGVGLTLGVGVSALPVTLSVMPSRTATVALF